MSDRIPTDDNQAGASDIVRAHWSTSLFPPAAHPYLTLARIDRPIGTWLLLLPGWWALALALPATTTGPELIGYFLLFGVGAIVMRGAGCVVNDIADRKFDAAVARTANRPIASGRISILSALIFMAGLSSVGLIILLQFNAVAIAVGVASFALIVPYPFMKRITYWPQAFLGLTFNWGALLGWAAASGTIEFAALVLYAAGFFWTLAYDTIYAHQDKEDDALVGVKSTALMLGDRSRVWIVWFFAATVILLVAVGLVSFATPSAAWPYWAALAGAVAHAVWQVMKVDFANPASCLRMFKANRDFGLILLIGMLMSRWTV